MKKTLKPSPAEAHRIADKIVRQVLGDLHTELLMTIMVDDPVQYGDLQKAVIRSFDKETQRRLADRLTRYDRLMAALPTAALKEDMATLDNTAGDQEDVERQVGFLLGLRIGATLGAGVR